MKDTDFTFRMNLDLGSQELTEDYIRQRAYQIYEQRGRENGHDVEDWLEAEAEVFGKKLAPVGESKQALSSAA